MIHKIVATLVLLLLGGPAFAQQNVVVIPNNLGQNTAPVAATITSTHGTLVPASTYGFVEVENQSDTATIFCVWGGTAAAIPTAGQYEIFSHGGYIWDALNPPPKNKILDCISSAASSPATVRFY